MGIVLISICSVVDFGELFGDFLLYVRLDAILVAVAAFGCRVFHSCPATHQQEDCEDDSYQIHDGNDSLVFYSFNFLHFFMLVGFISVA